MWRLFSFVSVLVGIASATTLREMYSEIKAKATTWEVMNPDDSPFADMTPEELAQYFPRDPKGYTVTEKLSSQPTQKKSSLPASFDARQKWEHCIHKVRNQGKCGSCYAHGSSEVLSDRFCIHSNGKINVELSPQDAVSCGRLICNGCSGCLYPYLWTYWYFHGAVTEECFPYKDAEVPCAIAEKKCVNPNVEYKKYYIKQWSQRYPYKDIELIKEEIMTNGPVSAVMWITMEYVLYKGGIFAPVTGNVISSHLFKVIGWGIENGIEYWIVQDSMGVEFGEKGYSRIKMGVLGIDSHMSWAMPDI